MKAKRILPGLVLLAVALPGGCVLFRKELPHARLALGRPVVIETTAYCPCGKCCSWRRNWLLRPVVATGPNRGQPKAVGITASGRKARPGMIAADTRHYPFGTIIYIPGYGYGTVADRGGDIQGPRRLDLFFNTHAEAVAWGRKTLQTVVFPPGTPPIPKNTRPPR